MFVQTYRVLFHVWQSYICKGPIISTFWKNGFFFIPDLFISQNFCMKHLYLIFSWKLGLKLKFSQMLAPHTKISESPFIIWFWRNFIWKIISCIQQPLQRMTTLPKTWRSLSRVAMYVCHNSHAVFRRSC